MNKKLWMLAAAVLVVAASVTLIALPRSPEWTTSSAEALAAFEAGNEAQMKVYRADAYAHYRRAHELDPEFKIATLRFAQYLFTEDPEAAEKLFVQLEDCDLSDLTEREILLISRVRAFRNEQPSEADRLLDAYLVDHPRDAQGLALKANSVWNRGQLQEAELQYRRLLEVDPNWVTAYNALGYIALMQRRFDESEEHFKSYRYIAPDQANPHDSLGELYITTGRFAEAEASLNRAIAIKPDFWASYQHLAVLHSFASEPQRIWEAVDSARAAGMPDADLARIECMARYSELNQLEEWDRILELSSDPCVVDRPAGYASVTTHRAACEIADWDRAKRIEETISSVHDEYHDRMERIDEDALMAALLHVQGVRLAKQGEYASALKMLSESESLLTYMRVEHGTFKLFNWMVMAEISLAKGDAAQAHKQIARLRTINPAVVEDFESSGFRVLGLDRG